MGFERIRVLRHLFGGSGKPEMTGFDDAQSLQAQVELRAMLRSAQEHALAEVLLTELSYAVVDTETTGFSPQTDALLSIGAVACDLGTQCSDAFHTYIALRSDMQIPPVVAKLTGITAATLRSAPPLDRALQLFLQYVGDRIIVAHHAGHDMRFLTTGLRRAWGIEWQAQVLDTGKIAMCVHELSKYPSLDALLAFYEIPVVDRHSAAGDALMTTAVARRLFVDCERAGLATLGALWERLLWLEHQHRPHGR